ncbi:MAG: hypothetical protein IJ634_02190 [Bacteroidales bacterium]|nr:hypothetical protein [Bacteroidales bacterium]
MKHTSTIALAALACLLTTACGPLKYSAQSTTDPKNPNSGVSIQLPGTAGDGAQHTFVSQHPEGNIKYVVDGQQYIGEVTTEEDIATLYLKILGFAKLGHNVSVTARDDNPKGTKTDTHTFTSESEVEVASWAARMVRKGYSVTIEYDKSKHTYTCTAYKKK